jgi:protein-S-isoprenylcysteine O-methyltransferase Ste14
MKPYFDTSHFTGALLLVPILAWGTMELSHRAQGNQNRAGSVRIGQPGFRIALLLCLIAGAAVLYLAPRVVPAAAIRPPVAAFAIGLVILVGGLVLRGWSFLTLGRYFTHTVMVSSDQPVITAGPYSLLRHPSYAGLVLSCAGVGLTAANWVSLAGVTLLPLGPILWRIHVEEKALGATLGDRYHAYASSHKRLVPFVW